MKLPRFRGHRTIWVRGVHDGQDKSSLPFRRQMVDLVPAARRRSWRVNQHNVLYVRGKHGAEGGDFRLTVALKRRDWGLARNAQKIDNYFIIPR